MFTTIALLLRSSNGIAGAPMISKMRTNLSGLLENTAGHVERIPMHDRMLSGKLRTDHNSAHRDGFMVIVPDRIGCTK